jgi:hypothetical protein
MDKNLIPLEDLYKVIKEKDLNNYISSYGYSKRKNKKYYVILKDDKVVHFGDTRYEDYLIHKDNNRRSKFRNRFKKLYEKNKSNLNAPIYWSFNILW